MTLPTPPFRVAEDTYNRVRALVERRLGLVYDARRRDALGGWVWEAAGLAGFGTVEAYCDALERTETEGPVWGPLVSKLTVGETYFFRDRALFRTLQDRLLPELIEKNRNERRLRIWSAGCATGEEPYSIAILLHHVLPELESWTITVLASDINQKALRAAREGWYRGWSFRDSDETIRSRFFTHQDGRWHIQPPVKGLVTFSCLNLIEATYPALLTNTNGMDLILWRNVAIYMTKPVIRAITERFYRCLVDGGRLILSAAESGSEAVDERFVARHEGGITTYEKPAPKPSPGPLVDQPGTEPSAVTDAREPRRAGAEKRTDVPPGLRGVTDAPRVGPVPSRGWTDLYDEAQGALAEGNYEGAIRDLRDCLVAHPSFGPAHCEMARAYANRGAFEDALRCCEDALRLDPFMITAHYLLSLIHLEEGRPQQAVEVLNRVVYLDPTFVLAHFSLAVLHKQHGRMDLARRHRAQALRLATQVTPDQAIPESEGITAGQLLTLLDGMDLTSPP